MSDRVDVMGSSAMAILVIVVLAWLVSLPLGHPGPVEIAWGIGSSTVAWVAWLIGAGDVNRSNLIVAMVSIWGIRTAFQGWRHASAARTTAIHHSESLAIRSVASVFLVQGVIIWIVTLPVQLSMAEPTPAVGGLAIAGAVVWGIGLFFETVGEAQLNRFNSEPANHDKVLDWGLWRYSRHPNLFGRACVWWGVWLIAAETTWARPAVIGPVLLTVLLVGRANTNRSDPNLHSRENYLEYTLQTSGFVPLPPRHAD